MEIIIKEDKIQIISNGRVMVGWKKQAWVENPDVVLIIAEAIKIAKDYPQGLIPFLSENNLW